MITTIRSLITSKIGAGIALAFLVFIGFAFALSDVNNAGSGGAVSGGNIIRVGDKEISTADLKTRLQRAYEGELQRQPGLTMAQYIAGGGLDRLITQTGDVYALEQYARQQGVSIAKAAIDAIIARNPAFAGLNGSFSQEAFEGRLRQEGTTPQRYRADLESSAIVRQLVAPLGAIGPVPMGVAVPYASLLLEQRAGQATFIPASRFAPTAAPTAAQLQAAYTGQRARYTVPETRSIRFAILDESAVRTPPAVTPADVAAEYQANAAQYAANESRRFTQVIAGSRDVANRVVAAARGGQTLSAAASASGLTAGPVAAESEAQYASATNPALATAAFDGASGAIIGPVQVPLGWAVVKIDGIDSRSVRTLAQVTPELTQTLMVRKRQEAMVDLFNSVQDDMNGGASVTEVAAAHGLRVVTTPALLPNGQSPQQPAFRADPIMPALLGPAFQMDPEDAGQVITLQENRIFALLEVADVNEAAPPPLAEIRDRVIADWRASEGARIARARARQILAAVDGGQTLAAASAAHGGAGVQPIGGRRINMTNNERGVPPEIALLFSMAPGTAKTLELPGNAGWMVIHLDEIKRNDATGQTDLVNAVRQQFSNALGAEYVGIVVAAARRAFTVTVNDAAVRQLRADLTGVPNSAPAN